MEQELPSAAPFGGSHSSLIASLQSSLESSTSTTIQNWSSLRAYGIKIAGINFIAKQGLYCELLTHFKLSSIPNAPDHFLGLTNVRGNLVPVYQLEPLIEGAELITKPKSAFMFDHPAHGAALVIKDKPQPMNMANMLPVDNADAVEKLPPFIRAAVDKTYSETNAEWHQLNHLNLFKYLTQFI